MRVQSGHPDGSPDLYRKNGKFGLILFFDKGFRDLYRNIYQIYTHAGLSPSDLPPTAVTVYHYVLATACHAETAGASATAPPCE